MPIGGPRTIAGDQHRAGRHDQQRLDDQLAAGLPRHATVATRYGLPLENERPAQQVARSWLLTDGATPRLDRVLGERRARAAIMILLALPGSTYIYQGDELGLHEVADLPRKVLEDPMATRSTTEKGRDGCRVPLPWTSDGPSYGFGAGVATCRSQTGSAATR